MSYYTRVEFSFEDGHPPDVTAILARARPYLEASGQGYSVEDVLENLKVGIEEEHVDFKGFWSDDVEGLMRHVSAGFPGITFFVRGVGEEFPDVWLRLFQDGQITFREGPFEDDFESALKDA